MNSTMRTFVLMAVLTVLFVWVGGYIGGDQGALIAFVIAALMNFGAYWFSDKMVLARYSAHQIGPDDNSKLYGIVQSLAASAKLPMPKVYLIPEKNPNAFATGRNPQHAAVAATEGIVQLLNDDELAGVMAHELAHVKHRDILTSSIAATFAGAITVLAQMSRFGMSNSRNRQNPLAALVIIIGAPIAALLIRMLISRIREYAADSGGAEISGRPLALASALRKIKHGVEQHPLTRGNPAHANMFIVNPFLGGLQAWLSTHPPVEERIMRLEAIAHSYKR